MDEIAKPKRGTFVCPGCSKPNAPTRVGVDLDADEATCPSCKKRYRVLSRAVTEVNTHKIDAKRTQYTIHTVENGGRIRPRKFDAPPGLRLRSRSWITLVYRGEFLTGVADQTHMKWNYVPPLPPRETAVTKAATRIGYVCIVLAALQALKLFHEGYEVFSAGGTAVIITIAIGLVVMLSPAFLWILRTAYDDGEGIDFKRRNLPSW